MSAPRKGKDLSALKARLAKKASDASPPSGGMPVAAPRRTSPEATAPVGARPPIGQRAAAMPGFDGRQPAAGPGPTPGGSAGPDPRGPVDEGQPNRSAARPTVVSGPPASMSASGADPFAGGSAFDPNAGIIGGSGDLDIKPRRSGGLFAVIAIGGVAVGTLAGFMLAQRQALMSKRDVAISKGQEMAAEVAKVADTRKRVSMNWEKIKGSLTNNPAAGAKQLSTVITENFKDYPKVDALFGWQLGSMHPKSIASVFNLYEEASGLIFDLSRLALFTNTNEKILAAGAKGPSMFAVVLKDGQATLAEYVTPLCGELKEGKACDKGSEKKASGHSVRLAVGGPEVAFEKDKVAVLVPKGPMYQLAIGEKPEVNARTNLGRLISAVDSRLETMNKFEKLSTESLQRYVDSPTVNADSTQPDPGE